MRYRISFIALLAGLTLNAPTGAATEPTDEGSPSELAREGMQRMLRALETMIEAIPQYELPEITEDGDIIIRRRPRPERDEPRPDSEIEETAI